MDSGNSRFPQKERQSHLPVALGLVSPEKEKMIVGSACKNIEFAEEAAQVLEANEFWDERNRYLFMAVKYVATQTCEPLDNDMITRTANSFAKRDMQPFQFMSSEIAALPCDVPMARGHIVSIKRDATHRQLAKLIEWGTNQLALSTDAAQLFHEFGERYESIVPKSLKSNVTMGRELADIFEQDLQFRMELSTRGRLLLPTFPWDKWNRLIEPPESDKLHIIGAPDGIGKSSIARAIAIHWAKLGFKTIFIHNEDSQKAVLRKIFCTEAMVPLSALKYGTATPEQMKEIRAAQERMKEWQDNFIMMDATDMSAIEAVQELITMRKENKCDLVMIDYMGAFRSTRGQGNMEKWQRITDNTGRLAEFSVRHSVPVMTMAQGTKAMLEPNAVLTRAHLMGAADNYQAAQTIILFTRQTLTEDFKSPSGQVIATAGNSSPQMVSVIDKQNDGAKGRITQWYQGEYFKITDHPWFT